MIDINRLRVIKNGRTICRVTELAISAGERVVILGPNGSGKSTLLRVLAGLETDYEGRCNVAAATKARVYVHQAPYLFRGTVWFNILYGLHSRGTHRSECEKRARHWLERLGLDKLSDERVTHLSGGEKRRVALARAMILRPRLLLLDEPLADIDQDGAAAVAAALDDLTESTVLIASPTFVPTDLVTREYRLQTSANDTQ